MMMPTNSWGKLKEGYFASVAMDDVAAYSFDAVISMGLAACASGTDYADGTKLFAAIKKLSFTGVSGTVEFDSFGTRKASTANFFIQNVLLTSGTLKLTD